MLKTLTSTLIIATTFVSSTPMTQAAPRQEPAEPAPETPPVPALGAFERELNGVMLGTQAMLLPEDGGTAILRSGRSISVIDPHSEGEVPRAREVSGAFTAACVLPDGGLAAFEEVSGDIRVWAPALDGPVLREVARIKLDPARLEPLVDVVDMAPFQDGYLLVERGAHRVRALSASGEELLPLRPKGWR